MPPKGKRRRNDSGQTEPLRLIANLLGLLAVKDVAEGDKVGTLSSAGFTNQEIAGLLAKDANTVRQALFQKRNRKKAKKRKK